LKNFRSTSPLEEEGLRRKRSRTDVRAEAADVESNPLSPIPDCEVRLNRLPESMDVDVPVSFDDRPGSPPGDTLMTKSEMEAQTEKIVKEFCENVKALVAKKMKKRKGGKK
jgi:hypothetical protein